MLWLDAVSIRALVNLPYTLVGIVHTRSTNCACVLLEAANFIVGGSMDLGWFETMVTIWYFCCPRTGPPDLNVNNLS